MAEPTITNRRQNQVIGTLRGVYADTVTFANNSDTWTIPGIKRVEAINLTPTTNTAYGFTVSGNIITLVASGGLTFRGGVLGL